MKTVYKPSCRKTQRWIKNSFATLLLCAIISVASVLFAGEPVFFTRGEGNLLFVENKGQVADANGQLRPDILFSGRSGAMQIFLRKGGLSYVLADFSSTEEDEDDEKSEVKSMGAHVPQVKTGKVDIEFEGSDPLANVKAEQPDDGICNYYLPQCPGGVISSKAYGRVSYAGLYPGIDVSFYSIQKESFEYDFIVGPGADPLKIRMKYSGANQLTLSGGRLKMITSAGEIEEVIPSAYQVIAGEKRAVTAFYELEGNTVSIKTGDYVTSFPLVIDPFTTWSTYYGGSSNWDLSYATAADPSGNIFITGWTYSTNFPVLTTAGGYNQTVNAGILGSSNSFVVKFNSAGTRQWATYYGGSLNTQAYGAAADASGNVIITGSTSANDMPIYNQSANWAGTTANATGVGSVSWSGTVTNAQGANNSAFASTGNMALSNVSNYLKATNFGFLLPASAVVCGVGVMFYWKSSSATLPIYDNEVDLVVGGVVQASSNKATGSNLIPSSASLKTYGGGADLWGLSLTKTDVENAGFGVALSVKRATSGTSGNATASVDAVSITVFYTLPGNPAVFQAGYAGNGDAFVLKLDGAGARQWATYYGGSDADQGSEVSADPAGNIFLTGITYSTNFPVLSAFQSGNAGTGYDDAFLVKFDSGGNRLWATYFGGNDDDRGLGVAADPSGNVFITGQTRSTNLPVLGGTQMSNASAGGNDVFLAKFSGAGARIWATYYGGSTGDDYGFGVATDVSGNVAITGRTYSNDFPVLAAYQTTFAGVYDAFAARFNASGTPQWSTYYGGSDDENTEGGSIAIDQATGNVFISGGTYSADFPVTVATACQTALGPPEDQFLVSFDPAGNRLCATYVGGGSHDEEADGGLAISGSYAYLTGYSMGSFPTTAGAFQTAFAGGFYDAFAAQIPTNCACSVVLGTDLLSFEGENKGADNLLHWITASEVNTDYFEIERSYGGDDFDPVGKVKAAGSSSMKQYYSFLDGHIQNSAAYRLRQVGYNGTYTYSNTIVISVSRGVLPATLSPNPVNGIIECTFYTEDISPAEIMVMDITGNTLVAEEKKIVRGKNIFRADLSRLAGGMYFISIRSGSRQEQLKFVKE